MYKAINNLDQVLEISREKPVLILKHSNTCPISARSKTQVDSFLAKRNGIEAYLVVVQKERGMSNEIERILGITHQSPQVLIVRDGKAVTALSHFRISENSLSRALDLEKFFCLLYKSAFSLVQFFVQN